MLNNELLLVEEVFDNDFITEGYRRAWWRIKKEYIELTQQHLTDDNAETLAQHTTGKAKNGEA